MVPVSLFLSNDSFSNLFKDFAYVLTSPSKLVTDYFELGSIAATFLNASLCGFACCVVCLISRAKVGALVLSGYFLVVAHCFYGLNFLNMWIPLFGVVVYCAVMKKKFGEVVHISFFCTSLGPFISDFLFRYTLGSSFDAANPRITFLGLVIAVVFGLAEGFAVPALIPGTTKMHRGHNLYKAGLAVGLFGVFSFAFFYTTLGISVPDIIVRYNRLYEFSNRSYHIIADIFFIAVFGLSFLTGFVMNGFSFKGFKRLLMVDGHDDDFPADFGIPLTLINIGIYGMAILLYYNCVVYFTEGAGFTGPTVGVIIAAITFSANGQTVRNVWPIVLGYMLLIGLMNIVCMVFGISIPASLSYQGYINGLAFATGLCPFAGKYGIKTGICAGFLDAVVCTSTSAMHGGFVLYNGGFAAGLTALILLPVLEYYNVKPKFSDKFQ